MGGRSVFSITLSAIFLLGACSGDKRVGGTIVLSSAADADVLFPPLTISVQGKEIVDQVFDNLADIGQSLNTVGDAGFTPRLADRWRWSSDSLSVAFHINPRARWHDGIPVSAEDVRYTFHLVKDTPRSPFAPNRSDWIPGERFRAGTGRKREVPVRGVGSRIPDRAQGR
jgi:ABC-type transport system substrate-binding protein